MNEEQRKRSREEDEMENLDGKRPKQSEDIRLETDLDKLNDDEWNSLKDDMWESRRNLVVATK